MHDRVPNTNLIFKYRLNGVMFQAEISRKITCSNVCCFLMRYFSSFAEKYFSNWIVLLFIVTDQPLPTLPPTQPPNPRPTTPAPTLPPDNRKYHQLPLDYAFIYQSDK